MKFTDYQKVVLGYQTIISMLQQRGFDTSPIEESLDNITEERVDLFFKAFQTKKQQGGADSGSDSGSDSDSDDMETESSDEGSDDNSDDSDEEKEVEEPELSLKPIGDPYSSLDKATTNNICDVLAENSIPQDQQIVKRQEIHDRLEDYITKKHQQKITADNVETLIKPHLLDMFHLYDVAFFNTKLSTLFRDNKCNLQLCWDKECVGAVTETEGKGIEITFTSKVFKKAIATLQKKNDKQFLLVGNIPCRDVLTCIQLVFESQLIQSIIDCFCEDQATADKKDAKGDWWGATSRTKKFGKTVMSVLYNTFGHTDFQKPLSKLITQPELDNINKELEKKKKAVETRRKKQLEKKEEKEKKEKKAKKKAKKKEPKLNKKEAKESLNLYGISSLFQEDARHTHILFLNRASAILKTFQNIIDNPISQYSPGDQVIVIIATDDSQPVYLPDENVYEIERNVYEDMGGTRLSIFHLEQIIRDISQHQFVPEHVILSQEESQEVSRRFRGQLPRLLAFQQDNISADMMGRFLGVVPGQIIKIIRKSPTTCQSITYRSVVGNIHDK